MTFSRIRPMGTWTGTLLTSELEAFDDHLSKALDGDQGGTYAPANVLVLGGAGLRVTTTLDVTGSAAVSGFLTATGGAGFSTSFSVNCLASFLEDVAVTGQLSVADFFTASGGAGFGGASFTVNAPAEFQQGVTFDDLATFNEVTTVKKEVVLVAGGGRITQTLGYAPDADHAYGENDYTRIIIGASISGAHSFTFTDATREGVEIEILNFSSFTHTLLRSGGVPITTVPPLHDTTVAGKVKIHWATVGATQTWWASERIG